MIATALNLNLKRNTNSRKKRHFIYSKAVFFLENLETHLSENRFLGDEGEKERLRFENL